MSQPAHQQHKLLSHPDRTIKELNGVVHVGHLQSPRKQPHFSLEGQELSVSVHPDDWKAIAHLSGDQTTLVHKDDEGQFFCLDPQTPVTDDEILVCLENNWIERTTGHRLTVFNEEYQTTTRFLFYNGCEAEQEALAYGKPPSALDKTEVFKLGEKGKRYCEDAFKKATADLGPLEVESLIPIWAAKEQLDVDGVWWKNRLCPAEFSAPRGCIFWGKLGRWQPLEPQQ